MSSGRTSSNRSEGRRQPASGMRLRTSTVKVTQASERKAAVAGRPAPVLTRNRPKTVVEREMQRTGEGTDARAQQSTARMTVRSPEPPADTSQQPRNKPRAKRRAPTAESRSARDGAGPPRHATATETQQADEIVVVPVRSARQERAVQPDIIRIVEETVASSQRRDDITLLEEIPVPNNNNAEMNDESVVVITPPRPRTQEEPVTVDLTRASPSPVEDDDLWPIFQRRKPLKTYSKMEMQEEQATSSQELQQTVGGVTCPICLENDKQISSKNGQMMSTLCGHLFCNKCLKKHLKNNPTCPTCRKVLAPKHVHPIYLP